MNFLMLKGRLEKSRHSLIKNNRTNNKIKIYNETFSQLEEFAEYKACNAYRWENNQSQQTDHQESFANHTEKKFIEAYQKTFFSTEMVAIAAIFVTAVLKKKGVAFFFKKNNCHERMTNITLASFFNSLYNFDGEKLKAQFPNQQISPYVDLLSEAWNAIGRTFHPQTPNTTINEHGEHAGEIFNKIILKIRELAKTKKHIKAIKNRRDSSLKNYKQATTYLSKLIESHGKVRLIFLELGYLSTHRDAITLDEAISHKARMLNNLRKVSRLGEMLGYICKMDKTDQKGLCFDFMFIFSENSALTASATQTGLIEYWEKSITNGTGTPLTYIPDHRFFDMDNYRTVERYDIDSIESLMYKVALMTKSDEFTRHNFKAASGKSIKAFTRGEISPKKNKIHRNDI